MANSNRTNKNKRVTFVDNLSNFSFECEMTRADRLPAEKRVSTPLENGRTTLTTRRAGGSGRGE